jgi:3-oxoadipate enol-lactonase
VKITISSEREIAQKIGRTHGELVCGGNSVFFEASGAGIPIVFVHDGLLHSKGFDRQFEFFKEHYTVIRYDRPGYGQSPPPVSAISDITTLKDLLTQIGIEKAILIGGSAGGRIVLDFAVAHSNMVHAIVLVGPALSGFEFTEHMWYRGWRNKWGDTIEEMISFWENDPWLISQENVNAKRFFRDTLLASQTNLKNYEVENLDEVQAINHLSEIGMPVLVMIGESDIADNHSIAGIIQNGIPDAQRVIVTQSGHLVYVEQPEKFNKLMGEFLEKLAT